MCSISFSIYGMKLNEWHFSAGIVIKRFYQEISKVILKDYYIVNKKKHCQTCSCPLWFYFALLLYDQFCNEIEERQFIKVIGIF